jgi:phage baseplate assembly protein W
VRESIEAIRTWEKRLTVVDVVVEVVETSTIRVRVVWKVAAGVLNETEVLL